MTPAGIAAELEAATAALPPAHPQRRLLLEALDALSDGMPPEYVARILYQALSELGA